MTKRVAAVVAGVILLIFEGAVPASAHGIGGRLDLPVPLSYFIVTAGLVLVVSFVILALAWPEPRLQSGPAAVPGRLTVRRRWFLPTLGVLSLMAVIGQVLPPFFGLERETSRPTIAPVLVWVVFWLVVPFASAFVGNWYTDLNPWRALARRLRVGIVERPFVLFKLGVWPAGLLFLAFTWLELVSPLSGSPVVLAAASLAYTLALMTVMALVGRETGLASFDAFTPYNRLLSAMSPVGRRDDGRLVWRGWLRALTVVPAWRGLPFLVIAAIGSVSFDGASGTSWYRATFGDFGQSTAGATVLLVGFVLTLYVGYHFAAWSAASLAGVPRQFRKVAGRFAHTLVPIALAYAVAHYLTLILFEGQQLISTISDPFGLGWDVFGTADRKVDFFISATEPIWYVQVTVIVIGHVLGVILAHDRALADFGLDAVRSQYPMLVLMVALTTVGLLILSG